MEKVSFIENFFLTHIDVEKLIFFSILAGFGLWEILFGKQKMLGIICLGAGLVLLFVLGVIKLS